jgi:hypothetical protein
MRMKPLGLFGRLGLIAITLCGCATAGTPVGLPDDGRCRVFIDGLSEPHVVIVENDRAFIEGTFGPVDLVRWGQQPDELVTQGLLGWGRIGRYAERQIALEGQPEMVVGDGVVQVPRWPEEQVIRFKRTCSDRDAALGATAVYFQRLEELRPRPSNAPHSTVPGRRH